MTIATPTEAQTRMKTLDLELRYHTPAFPGNAEQNAQWRTPPFKAQLRQFWRMAYAAAKGFLVNINDMRTTEGRLFGNAWLERDFCRSRVRLRLDQWNVGSLTRQQWRGCATVRHPEVRQLVPSDLYLGYGPVTLPRQSTAPTLKSNAAIQAGEHARLSLAYPEEDAPLIERALRLMHHYGTVGGRSRNGWGSYSLALSSGEAPADAFAVPQRAWKDCLGLDWPHAIGRDDEGALIWQTAPHKDWRELMKTLATIRIGLRTRFRFTNGNNAPSPEERHWLSYPVTNHSVESWARNNARLPNTLRFKARPAAEGGLVCVIFHIPHLPPPAFAPNINAITNVWTEVHRFLDDPAQNLKRIGM